MPAKLCQGKVGKTLLVKLSFGKLDYPNIYSVKFRGRMLWIGSIMKYYEVLLMLHHVTPYDCTNMWVRWRPPFLL